MRLIGMMDSPYVRRVAVSLKILDLPATHEQISVFREIDAFKAINPVVKAPSLITDDGITLMDSTLILDYLDRLVAPERRLTPSEPDTLARSHRIVGLALAACEKTVQIVYEINLRPAEKQHQPWIDRVTGQLLTAYRLLETEVTGVQGWLIGLRPMQADISAATAWRFTQHVLAGTVVAADFPALAGFSRRTETLTAFRSSPLE